MAFGLLCYHSLKGAALILLVAGVANAYTYKPRGENVTASLHLNGGVSKKVMKEGISMMISELEVTNLQDLNFEEMKLQLEEDGTKLILNRVHFGMMNTAYYQDNDRTKPEYSTSVQDESLYGEEEMVAQATLEQVNPDMETWYGQEPGGPAFAIFARSRSSGYLSGTVQTNGKVHMVSTRSDGSVFCSAASTEDVISHTKSIPPLTFEDMDEEQRADVIRQQEEAVKGTYSLVEAKDESYDGRSLYAVEPYSTMRVIDMAVFYTNAALCSDGGICDVGAMNADIDNFVAYTNHALLHSGVAAQIRIVAREMDPSNYGQEIGDALLTCSNAREFWANTYIHGRRSFYGADVAALVTAGSTSGCVPFNPIYGCINQFASGCIANAYMAVNRGVNPFVFAHEFGHILGLLDPVQLSPGQVFDPNVCGCDSLGPVCGRSIGCNGYNVCTGRCSDMYGNDLGPIPNAPWYHPYSRDIMNQNAILVDNFFVVAYWHYDPWYGWTLVWASVGIAGIIMAMMKKRRIIRSEDNSVNNYFLEKEGSKETATRMMDLLWHQRHKTVGGNKEQGVAVKLSPTFESSGSGGSTGETGKQQA